MRKEKENRLKSGRRNISEWIELFKRRDHKILSCFESIYGKDKNLIDERLDAFLKVAIRFKEIYGQNKEASFIRAPGRLNTLGMHIDHRGGFVNPIAINREVVFCYAGRKDDLIQVHNLEPSYGVRKFSIAEEIPPGRIDSVREWLAWTQEKTNRRKELGIDHDWVNKLKSIPVYLKVKFPQKNLLGLNGVMDSNIPAGMGLSSSSAIVVAMMEAMTEINGISLSDDEFVNYCGIGEWYVGTRGGSGDHAAIKFGRLGMITHMKTLPNLMIKSYLPFPQGYRMIIFNSGIMADKSGSARQKFNEKTATYEIGEIYLREYMKKYHGDVFQRVTERRKNLSKEDKKFFLADVVEYLSQSQIYRLLQSLPERMSREELIFQLPNYEDLIKEQFATHLEPEEGYQIRSVITYGISECERSRMLEEVTKQGNIEKFGQMMTVSHDGDRVHFRSPEEKKSKRSIDPSKDLYLQSGGYDCSIPEIDEMVDIALEAGAEGAQISGAGLGGSMMALVREEKLEKVCERLRKEYYIPHKIKEDFIIVSPIQGAGQI